MNFCCAQGPRPVRSICFMRQAPDGSSREERAHGSISAAAAGRPDSYNTTNSQHIFMCRAPSTAVDDSLWRGVDLGSSLTACILKKVILCAMNFCCAPGPHPVLMIDVPPLYRSPPMGPDHF